MKLSDLYRAIREASDLEIETISKDSTFYDLGFGSSNFSDLIELLEDEYQVDLGTSFDEVETVEDLLITVDNILNA